MTQHKQMIDEARMLLNTERENIPSMSGDFSKDYWLLTYPCGKIVGALMPLASMQRVNEKLQQLWVKL